MTPADPSDDTTEYPCLVRVTDGKEVNFSTRVRSLLAKMSYIPLIMMACVSLG